MAELNARETLYLELVNRARMDPLAEAARYGLADLNQNLPAGTISATPKAILAVNTLLTQSALGHSAWMNTADVFSHTGAGGSTPTQRTTAAGYTLAGNWMTAENISWTGSTSQPSYDPNAEVYEQHKNLFLSAGHRENTLNDGLREIGIGTNLEFFNNGGTQYYGMMSAFNFATSGTSSFISGVAYNDANHDGFYTIGEGLGGITAQLLNGGSIIASAVSQAAGAFALATTAIGILEMRFSGGALTGTLGVLFNKAADNVKVDVAGLHAVETNVSATLTQSATDLFLLGAGNISGTGNAVDNLITGNRAHNILNGGAGNDTLIGGAGTDTVIESGSAADYSIVYDPVKAGYVLHGLDGSTDTAIGIERFQFADGTLTAAQLTLAPGSPTPPPPIVIPPSPATIISGSAESESLMGTDSDNIMLGLKGNDTLDGGMGNDELVGGKGRDALIGGEGQDRFDFTALVIKKNADTIVDFNPEEDLIRLGKAQFKAIGAAFTAGEFCDSGMAHDKNDHIIYNSVNGKLFYDVDGKGGATAILFAKVTPGTALSFGDFLFG